MKLFVSPHCDDECLFGAFTILREKPLVVIVFDGYVQEKRGLDVTWDQRRAETAAAMEILGVSVTFLGFRDDDAGVRPIDITNALALYESSHVYAPAFEVNGHAQHNLVYSAVSNDKIAKRYMTYTTAGKSISLRPVPVENGEWIALKLQALACYKSQLSLDARMGCWPHFLRNQNEYYDV